MAVRACCLALLCGLLVACGEGSRGGGSIEGRAAAPATPDAAGSAALAASPPAAQASGSAAASSAAAAASAPPVSVSVVRAMRRDVAVQIEATGTVSALASVDVKPQLASVVTGVHVKEGQFVGKGQLLFTLDGRADAANLARAEAQLMRDQATLADAQRQLARSQDLLARNFVSQSAVDTAQANADAQRAALAADKAAIEAARVAVSYSRIVAPSAGRVGQINVFAGTSVAPTGLALVTITQLDPIAVSFNLPQRHVTDALQALAAAQAAAARPAAARTAPAAPAAAAAASAASSAGPGPAGGGVAVAPGEVRAVLPEGRGTRVGRLEFVDSVVDATSGTVRVKALFGNKDQALWPGAYVNVQVALQSLPGAVVIPQASIVQGARGTAVFVADADGLAAIRPVQVLQALGSEAAVSGLRPGEKVVLDGRQNVRPGVRLNERTAGAERAERATERAGGGRGAASGPGGGGSGAPAGAARPASAASRAAARN
ncbi:MAG: efflux RND transporter periplasmic adaptor subunit [Burkholderiales bacterium]|nr:efflux RND transporter periplasmic adaptor subunit [Burkholderiales bacterium]